MILPVAVPILLLYALYVLVHGEVSLGGGFQAGSFDCSCVYSLLFLQKSPERKSLGFHSSALPVSAREVF